MSKFKVKFKAVCADNSFSFKGKMKIKAKNNAEAMEKFQSFMSSDKGYFVEIDSFVKYDRNGVEYPVIVPLDEPSDTCCCDNCSCGHHLDECVTDDEPDVEFTDDDKYSEFQRIKSELYYDSDMLDRWLKEDSGNLVLWLKDGVESEADDDIRVADGADVHCSLCHGRGWYLENDGSCRKTCRCRF